MADPTVLTVSLYGEAIGTLTLLPGDKSLFAFSQDYIDNADRPTLSLSFKDHLGALITDVRTTQTRVLPFFSNLLPEGPMRDYLAQRASVKSEREYFLLWALGKDLPGAITVTAADDASWPSEAGDDAKDAAKDTAANAMRFSLAGVQLKFSAVKQAHGGLTIPVEGVGGSWIVKLPSMTYANVPENEFSMMTLAQMIGMDVPEVQLIDSASIGGLPEGIDALKASAFAVKRFDRPDDATAHHIEDFAQVFGVYPEGKYDKASYRNIASVLAAETPDEDIVEFIRRLVFSALIGNSDMHLKNWSLIYRDKRTARLAPAYDFVSTIGYIPDDNAALKYSRTRRMDEFTLDELAHLAAKAKLPQKLVLDTASETVERFHDAWKKEKTNLALSKDLIAVIETHLGNLPLAKASS